MTHDYDPGQAVSTDGGAKASTLHGLGDKHHAISATVVGCFAAHKQAVNVLSQDWKSTHGAAIGGADIPDLKPRWICSDICVHRATNGANPMVYQKIVGLLRNVCRAMKPDAQAEKKKLNAACRHPVLLARCGDTKTCAWILSHPTFKPLTFDGVQLEVSTSCVPPCTFQLGHKQTGGKELLNFVSLKRVAADMVALSQAGGELLEYCFTKKYKLLVNTPLSHLHFEDDFNWVSIEDADCDGGDEDGSGNEDNNNVGDEFGDDEDDNDDDDIVSEAVNMLLRREEPNKKKTAKVKAKTQRTLAWSG